jgi:hypothetical protein
MNSLSENMGKTVPEITGPNGEKPLKLQWSSEI